MTKERIKREESKQEKSKRSGGNDDVLDSGQAVKIWEVINTLKVYVISLTERFENITETKGVDMIKELPTSSVVPGKVKNRRSSKFKLCT